MSPPLQPVVRVDMKLCFVLFPTSCIQNFACKDALHRQHEQLFRCIKIHKTCCSNTNTLCKVNSRLQASSLHRCCIAAKEVSLLSYRRWTLSAADLIYKAPFTPGVSSPTQKKQKIAQKRASGRLTRVTCLIFAFILSSTHCCHVGRGQPVETHRGWWRWYKFRCFNRKEIFSLRLDIPSNFDKIIWFWFRNDIVAMLPKGNTSLTNINVNTLRRGKKEEGRT